MNQVLIAIIIISVISCKKSKTPPVVPALPPAEAVLVTPANNAPCNEGQVISEAESTVQLSWNTAANTESYEVKVKNLLTSVISTHPSTSTQLSIKLLRATPYSWYVVSKSSKVNTTAQSATWRFYNAGPAGISYAPYPADQLAPAMGQAVTAVNGKVSLTWVGEDPDNDIKSYEVYLGTSKTDMPKIKTGLTASLANDIIVSSGTTYFWKVLTEDLKGNKSTSEVLSFKVN